MIFRLSRMRLNFLCLTCEKIGVEVDEMRDIIHTDYEGRPLNPTAIDDCMLNNLNAAVVRSGAEPFKSFYAVEWYSYRYSVIDPTRSFVDALIKLMDEHCSAENNWPASDVIHMLMRDVGFDFYNLSRADLVAFWTMFPNGLSHFLSLPYMNLTSFNNPHGDMVRVLNNPFFYRDVNAPYGRLVEIAEVNGFRFALDRACFIAPPAVLAKELALLNYGCNEPEKVTVIEGGLTSTIAETMDDWGLAQQTKGGV